MGKNKKHTVVRISVTDYLPQHKGANGKKYLKQYRLIECIIDHFNGVSEHCSVGLDATEIGTPLDLTFFKQNALGPNVSDNLFVEAWRSFLEMHSLWQFGPRGFYLANGRTPCEGCGDKFCHFAQEQKCSAVGKWLANTVLRPTATPIPLPLDPLFVQMITKTIHLFDGLSEEDATEEYERLLEGRENMIWKITEGFFAAEETAIFAKEMPIPVLVSWLCHPTPIDRVALRTHMDVIAADVQSAREVIWFTEWLDTCSEMQLRWFLMEVLGTPILRPNIANRFDVNFAEEGLGTTSDICQNILTLPPVGDRNLFVAILNFRGPFLINR